MAINPLPTQDTESTGSFRRIGDLLAETTQLSEHDVKRVVAQQRKHGMRFGEAARKLGLVSEEDVQRTLAQQFRYP